SAIDDLVDPPARAVHTVVVVALAEIRPVGQVDSPVRSICQRDASEPRRIREQEVGGMREDVTRTVALDDFLIHPAAVGVAHEEPAAVLGWPVVSEINHAAAVRVAAAEFRRLARRVARRLPLTGGIPVIVIGVLFNQFVQMRVEVLAIHPLVTRAGNDVPRMPDDVVREEQLAVLVIVHSPRVRRSPGDNLEKLPNWVIAPDAAVDGSALTLGRSWPTRAARREDAVPTIKPAVRP